MAGKDKPSIVLIGLGNRYRSDDAVGILVAERMREAGREFFDTIVGVKDGTDMIDAWADKDLAIVVDCALTDREPGAVYRYEPLENGFPDALSSRRSTHVFSLSEVISLGRTLNRLPKRLVVYAISGDSFDHGEELSPGVKAVLKHLCTVIRDELPRDNITDTRSARTPLDF
jgi:hydrogenase maturation protease